MYYIYVYGGTRGRCGLPVLTSFVGLGGDPEDPYEKGIMYPTLPVGDRDLTVPQIASPCKLLEQILLAKPAPANLQ